MAKIRALKGLMNNKFRPNPHEYKLDRLKKRRDYVGSQEMAGLLQTRFANKLGEKTFRQLHRHDSDADVIMALQKKGFSRKDQNLWDTMRSAENLQYRLSRIAEREYGN